MTHVMNINGVMNKCLARDRLRGAMVARLTPDQKAACSSHVGVIAIFLGLFQVSR